jgi:hypothetical protein
MRRGLAISCSLFFAVTVLAACGGGDSTAKSPATDANAGSGSGQLSSAELATLVAAAAKQKFKVAYTDGSGNTLRYAQDGAGNTMQATAGSESFSTKSTTISCDKDSGTFQCTQTPGGAGAADSPFTSVVTLLQSFITGLDGDVGNQSTKTIAGRDAQCITFDARDLSGNATGTVVVADPKVSATYCIDKDTGATLEVAQTDASGKASTSLMVTEFGTPSASDFVPPATPTPSPG